MPTMSDGQPECPICLKHRGGLQIPGGAIYQDDLVYAGHAQIKEGQDAAYLGYLMVETRRHIRGLADFTRAEAGAVTWLAARLAAALQSSRGADHVYAFVIGDHVPHFHLHLVPRYPGAPRQFWGVRVDEWPEAPRGGPAAIEQLCQHLRQVLEAA
jgi:histidine triad (HIT) family protein